MGTFPRRKQSAAGRTERGARGRSRVSVPERQPAARDVPRLCTQGPIGTERADMLPSGALRPHSEHFRDRPGPHAPGVPGPRGRSFHTTCCVRAVRPREAGRPLRRRRGVACRVPSIPGCWVVPPPLEMRQLRLQEVQVHRPRAWSAESRIHVPGPQVPGLLGSHGRKSPRWKVDLLGSVWQGGGHNGTEQLISTR